MVKEQIMSTAFDLFAQYGIKSVSMDDIAQNICISKRTLYEFFKDKETLLMEAIGLHYNRLRIYLENLEKEPFTVLDVILLFYEEFMKHPRWFSRKFYDDLKRYPKAFAQAEKNKAMIGEKCMQLFQRGVKEGVFQPNVNFEIVAILAKEQAKMIRPSHIFSNHSVAEVFNTVLYTFLRGISTEKGLAILERYTFKKTYIQ